MANFFYFTALLEQSVSSDNYLFVSVSEIVFLCSPSLILTIQPHENKFLRAAHFLIFKLTKRLKRFLGLKRDPKITIRNGRKRPMKSNDSTFKLFY
jgi:hypothetical protein